MEQTVSAEVMPFGMLKGLPRVTVVSESSLNVSVVEGSGRYVTDLAPEDFSVFEDGVKQEVTFFNRTNLPIALALLLDTSASMETRLPVAQEAAIGFGDRRDGQVELERHRGSIRGR